MVFHQRVERVERDLVEGEEIGGGLGERVVRVWEARVVMLGC